MGWRGWIIATATTLAMAVPARADMLLDQYDAYISQSDLFNSSGVRLTKPWQVIRQDRANFHVYRRRDPGDRPDSFFASEANRATMEDMIRRGHIDAGAARAILAGDLAISVAIYGTGAVGSRVVISVIGPGGGSSVLRQQAPCTGVVLGLADRYDPASGSGFLALRAGPRTAASQVGELFNGMRLDVIARQGEWVEVHSADLGRSGFVGARWLRIDCN